MSIKSITKYILLFAVFTGLIFAIGDFNSIIPTNLSRTDLDDGSFGFDYSGTNMSGSFYVEGIPDSATFPTEGAVGFHTMYNDSVIAVFSGIEAISIDSVNAGLVFLHQPGELTTGSYAVDPMNLTALFGFGVGINGMIDLDSLTSFEDIEADKIYVSGTGTITIDEINETEIVGTFTGLMLNIENPMDMVWATNGEFSIYNSDALSTDPTVADQFIPSEFSLRQNYPNPFNPSTTIEYKVYAEEHIQLKVFDLNGNELDILINENHAAGMYSLKWDGSRYSSGIYLYQLVKGSSVETRKMLLIK